MADLPWFLTKGAEKVYLEDVAYVVLDFETTNLEKGSALNPDNRIVLACWDLYEKGEVKRGYVFGDEYDMSPLLEDLKKVKFIVAQGAKFEMQWLHRCGLDLRDYLFYDTLMGAWVIDGNLKKDRNLNALAARIGLSGKVSLVDKLIKAGVCPSKIKREWLLDYCQVDLDLTTAVFRDQLKQLDKNNQLHLVHTRNLTAACLATMEFAGLILDKEAVDKEYKITAERREQAAARLYELTGGINLSSPKQLAEFIYVELGFKVPKGFNGKEITTKSGALSTKADTLALLKARNEKQREFLHWYKEFNKADSLITKNLEFFKGVCEEYGCKFYGSFNLGIAGTHRLTSGGRPLLLRGAKKPRGIQLQNIPREYKRLFCADGPGRVVVEGDAAQLEFRVAADLGRDAVAATEIANDTDVHSITAEYLTLRGYPGFDVLTHKERRQGSKAFTFKPMYGGAFGHKAVVDYCEFFKEKYKGIAAAQWGWAMEAVNTKKQVTPYGMIFYWPGTRNTGNGRVTSQTQIYNYAVQGLATGEIIPIALVHFWHRSRGTSIETFITIHDSIGARVNDEEVELSKQLLRQSLTDDVYRYLREIYNYEFVTPLGVGVKASRNWGTADVECIWNVAPDGTIISYKEK